MKFINEQQREELIKGFEETAKALTASMKSDIPEDSVISFDTITEYDETNSLPSEDNPEPKAGKLYVAYIKQPHILTAIKVLDLLNQRRNFDAGFLAWEAMIIKSESSKEIQKDKYKLGLCARLGYVIEMAAPDFKKK